MKQQEFLDEIENDIHTLCTNARYVSDIILKIKNYLDDRRLVWHPVRRLPTPRIPLKLRLDTGEVIEGWRPSYIASYGEHDLGYRDSADNILLNVVEWAIA